MVKLNLVESINLALKQEMKKDKSILILGEDVGEDGGVFRVTDGLAKLYGNERVIDTPLAESGIIGISIGLSLIGLKPIAEIQFEGFIFPAIDQLVNHASRMRNRSRGRFSCPMVVRCPIGGGVRALEHHSDSPETHLIHTPGLKVLMPSTPFDAKGLLISAIRDPDPVIFFEPKKIYRSIEEDIMEEEYNIPIGKANIIKKGKDLTLISYGSNVKTCFDSLKKISDIDVEIIDLRSLSPLDMNTIINSVKKTGKVVIVNEAPKTLGFPAEIITRIMESCFYNLEAPIERVTGYDTIMPLRLYEKNYLPSEEKIINAIKKVMITAKKG